eukprot:4921500-Pyramimonas_sp.AAC.1
MMYNKQNIPRKLHLLISSTTRCVTDPSGIDHAGTGRMSADTVPAMLLHRISRQLRGDSALRAEGVGGA